jgi:2-phospho-L-lactate guanylyltransferase
MDIWALIPVKSLLDSKRRLAQLLTAEERAELIRGLLQRQLSLLNQVPGIEQVLVISSDPVVWKLARQYGALVEEEAQSVGLNLAVTRGTAVAAESGASAVLILPVDLPFMTAADVDLLLNSGLEMMDGGQESAGYAESHDANGSAGSHEPWPMMVICSDEEGEGSNALFIHPAQPFTFQFGPGSLHKHIQEAEKQGMIVNIISTPGLSFDIDNESDWLTYQASRVGC